MYYKARLLVSMIGYLTVYILCKYIIHNKRIHIMMGKSSKKLTAKEMSSDLNKKNNK